MTAVENVQVRIEGGRRGKAHVIENVVYIGPVVLHRAILGSLDRFMAYLIEETKGKFPTWLAPTQVKVLPVSEKTLDYAEGVTEKLVEAGVRVVLDDDNQKIGYKIRAAQQVDRVPYMLVLGAKEAEAGNISVRDRKGETTEMSLEDFIAKVTTEIRARLCLQPVSAEQRFVPKL